MSVQMHSSKRIFRRTDAKMMEKTLNGARFRESFAHGKQMLFRFGEHGWLGLHLGMTGKLRLEKNASFAPLKHDHLVLQQKNHALVFSDPRLFGRVLFHQGPDKPDWWTRLPAGLSSLDFTFARFKTFLRKHGKAPIKAVLLLQNGFPGIGNWMADEILWQSRIHPRTVAGKIDASKLKTIFQKIRFVAQRALEIIGKDFSDPPKSWLFQYRWKNKGHCPRCGAILDHATIGGRTTCWCPDCQK
ncbi:MAG: DNA-formamidopyrimidine glycosylase family protein [Verrucomicrobiota bacterium]